jgi:hypothetical protein
LGYENLKNKHDTKIYVKCSLLIKMSTSTTYCVSLDGARVGTIAKDKCNVPKTGGDPVPYMYLTGPDATDSTAVANCASTDSTGIQTFSSGKCSNANDLTFYSFPSSIGGQPPLCFFTPATNSGIKKGTIVTMFPQSGESCEMSLNFNYQDVTCADTGCGDHGTCTNSQCVCEDYWHGNQCELPPNGSPGCTPDTDTKKSCGNLGSYGTCQSNTSEKTGILGSGACTCNAMTGQTGSYCEQHCIPNSSSACGGPLRGYCVDSSFNYFNNANAIQKRCACVNGWSGVDCTTPPPNWTCQVNKDCTNLTALDPNNITATGTCTNGICSCENDPPCGATNSNSTGNAFTGQACQIPLPVQGSPCTTDANCTSGLTCVGGVCSCPGSDTPQPSASFFTTLLNGLVTMLTTPQGLSNLAGMLMLQHELPMAIKYMTTKVIEKGFTKMIEDKIAKSVAGSLIGPDAARILEESVGKRMAAKVLGNMTTKEIAECTVHSAAKQLAASAFKDVFGFIGKIESFANMLNLVGMVLDAADVLGLNEESSQSQIDATIMKFNGAVNNNKTIIANGLYFPVKQPAQSTYPFLLKTLDITSRNQYATDAGDYLSHLTVNSNGNAIIPLFKTSWQKQQDALAADAKTSLLYVIAGQNLDVFQRLKQDWPIIVAGILLALGILIGSAFGIKALVNKKKL